MNGRMNARADGTRKLVACDDPDRRISKAGVTGEHRPFPAIEGVGITLE